MNVVDFIVIIYSIAVLDYKINLLCHEKTLHILNRGKYRIMNLAHETNLRLLYADLMQPYVNVIDLTKKMSLYTRTKKNWENFYRNICCFFNQRADDQIIFSKFHHH